MAAFDAAVSGLDTAPDLRLAAHQYEQLLHLLASADARRVPPAAAARRVFAHMLEAGAPPSEATITSLGRVVAADTEGATRPSGSSPPCGRSTASRRASGPTAPCLPCSGAPGRLERPTRLRPTWRPPLYRRKSPSSPHSMRSAQQFGTQTRCMSICTSCSELSAV
ncbi:hypothetical protein VPH35_104812 [Triticum aestivum]